MPEIRPFRALRYDPETVGRLDAVVAPPYDVIDVASARRLMDRHPRNAVRLDLPLEEPGDAPDERYRRAARTFAAWRSDGTLRKDLRPAVYVYEQAYRVPGTSVERTQRGFFARLRLEPLEPGSGVLPHERTMSGPKEDRYRLLRATGANTSPVVVLFEDAAGEGGEVLRSATDDAPAVEVTDDEGVRHRLWLVPAAPAGDSGEPSEHVTRLLGAASATPVVIADGHHRYETALRYRDERRMTRSCEEDPPFDYVLALLLPASEQLTVLPTHRIVRGLGDDGVGRLVRSLDSAFECEEVEREALVARFAAADAPGGRGRFGLVTRQGSFALTWREGSLADALPAGGDALRALDVARLGAALHALAGIDPAAIAGGERVGYTKSAEEAATAVAEGANGADAAFLLEPTPVDAILAVARAGDVMPQKSTYFYPKALTGIVFNPLEW